MLMKFWPMLAIVGEEKATRIGSRILGKVKTPFKVAINKFDFGTTAPRFCGIRVHQEGVSYISYILNIEYQTYFIISLYHISFFFTSSIICLLTSCSYIGAGGSSESRPRHKVCR
jgi:hypothetical protein